VSELASEPLTQRVRAVLNPSGPTERSEGVRVSELASEPWTQRVREAPTERSEGVR
jgi:hypothetical protein